MNTYDDCYVYQIYCKDTTIKKKYIGSTKNFINRIYTHRNKSMNGTSNLHTFIRANGGFDNFIMEKLQHYTGGIKTELLQIEKDYIQQEDESNILNMTRPIRTLAEKKLQKKISGKKHYPKWLIYSREPVECPICKRIYGRTNLYQHKKKCNVEPPIDETQIDESGVVVF